MTKIKKVPSTALNQNKKPFKVKKGRIDKPRAPPIQAKIEVKGKDKEPLLKKNLKSQENANKDKKNKTNILKGGIKKVKLGSKEQKANIINLINESNKKQGVPKFKGIKTSLKENGVVSPSTKQGSSSKHNSKVANISAKQKNEMGKKSLGKGEHEVSNISQSPKKIVKPDESHTSQGSTPLAESSKSKKQKKKTIPNKSETGVSIKAEVQENSGIPQSKKKELKNKKSKKIQKELKKNEGDDSKFLEDIPPFDEEEFNRILQEENIKKNIKILKNIVSEDLSSKNQIFTDYKYMLSVICFKIPLCPRRIVRLNLTHPLVDEEDDICLIVKDLKRGLKIDYEPTVQHYEDLLREKDVTNIKAIIPFNQLKKEYGSYEMKIKLSNLYDYYLCDGAIIKHVVGFLGRKFQKTKCAPHAVRMNGKNIKGEIEKALCRTSYKQGEKGIMISIPVGTHKMTAKKVTENIETIISQLKTTYPGGLANIRSLHVRVNIKGTPSLPLYVSVARPPDDVPVVIGPREEKLNKLKQKANQILSKFHITNAAEIEPLSSAQVKAKRQRQKDDDESTVPKKKTKQVDKKQNAAAQVADKENITEELLEAEDSLGENKQVAVSKKKSKEIKNAKNVGVTKHEKDKEEIDMKGVEKKKPGKSTESKDDGKLAKNKFLGDEASSGGEEEIVQLSKKKNKENEKLATEKQKNSTKAVIKKKDELKKVLAKDNKSLNKLQNVSESEDDSEEEEEEEEEDEMDDSEFEEEEDDSDINEEFSKQNDENLEDETTDSELEEEEEDDDDSDGSDFLDDEALESDVEEDDSD